MASPVNQIYDMGSGASSCTYSDLEQLFSSGAPTTAAIAAKDDDPIFPLEKLPLDLLSLITKFLPPLDFQNLAVGSNKRILAELVKIVDSETHKKFSEFDGFISKIIANLEKEPSRHKYDKQVRDFTCIKSTIAVLRKKKIKNMRILMEKIFSLKKLTIAALKTLDEDALKSLKAIDPLSFCENLVECEDLDRRIEKLWDKRKTMFGRNEDEENKLSLALKEVVSDCATVGEFDRAIHALAMMSGDAIYLEARDFLLRHLVERREIDKLRKFLSSHSCDPIPLSRFLIDSSEKMLEMGHIEEATKLADLIRDDYWRNSALITCAVAIKTFCLDSKLFDKADKCINAISDGHYSNPVPKRLRERLKECRTYASIGENDKASEIAQEIESAYESIYEEYKKSCQGVADDGIVE